MAKAVFHKNQRVFVRPVGTWAVVEKVVPHWVKGIDEPIRIYYELGLGREFSADELQAEDVSNAEARSEHWRVIRARNKSQSSDDTSRHPMPGTFPIVVTGELDWGGWRVPGAEYDLDPVKVERQARVIASAPHLVTLAKTLVAWAQSTGQELPAGLADLAHDAEGILETVDGKAA
ncbi:MAG TPA: hypothetical protein VHL34_03955 [Rhizomicrobium sp.]|jgi:hypothetical protein|nr:hypothetical protein [Rhizomicrobium sp.]